MYFYLSVLNVSTAGSFIKLFMEKNMFVFHFQTEQHCEKREEPMEELLELRTWNEQRDSCQEDTQVDVFLSQLISISYTL